MASKDKQNGKRRDHAVLMLPGIYNETLTLLAEAHDYFYTRAIYEEGEMDDRTRTMYTSEMSRITIRLSSVMAWLMARKAVFAGKLSEEDAIQHHRLDYRDICMNQHIEAESLLPDAMTDLLDKSFELYQRVVRLDALSDNVASEKR